MKGGNPWFWAGIFCAWSICAEAQPLAFSPAPPAGARISQAYFDGTITNAGQGMTFAINLNAGQNVSVVVLPGSSLWPAIGLTDPGSAPFASATAAGAGQNAVLEAAPVLTHGTYQMTISGMNGTTGDFLLRVVLNSAVERERYLDQPNNTLATAEDLMPSAIPIGTGGAQQMAVSGDLAGRPGQSWPDPVDFYRLFLYQGQVATVLVTNLGFGTMQLMLEDGTGNLLAWGSPGLPSASQVIQNFTAAYTGYYYLAVTGDSGAGYSAVVTLNAAFGLKSDNTLANAQPLPGLSIVAGNLDNPPGSVGTHFYSLQALAGDHLHFASSTPSPGPPEIANGFHPELLLYDPNGNLVAIASGNGFDGRNSIIDFTVPDGDAGNWVIEITPSPNTPNFSQGDYFLVAQGATGNFQTALSAVSTVPPSGGPIAPPTTYTIQFNQPIYGLSLTPGELTINGVPCVSVALTGPNSATWTVGLGAVPLGNNIHSTVVLDADPGGGQQVAGLGGSLASPYTSTLVTSTDLTPPAAGADLVAVRQDTPTNIPVSFLLSNDSSPIGSPLHITSVTNSSFATVVLTNGGTAVMYRPQPGFAGLDSFQYTLFDGRELATGTVTVIILSPGAPAFNRLAISGISPSLKLAYSGMPASQYAFQAAPTVTGPWSDLYPMLTAGFNGLIQFSNTTAVRAGFFRVKQVP